MKTIKEAAIYVAGSLIEATPDTVLEAIPEMVRFETAKQGFISGVNFTQRWISVEEKPDEPGWYLCKVSYQSVPETCHFDIGEVWNNKYVTHWRYIEIPE